MNNSKVFLDESRIPKRWYNVAADLPFELPPHIHPGTKEPLCAGDMAPLFPKDLIAQEVSQNRWINIPSAVRDILRLWRPTPLKRARRLEKAIGTSCRLYYKDESVSPTGSHKTNTAVAQAYYNKKAGIQRLATETGAGQWGSALSFACNVFGLSCRVYMVRVSYEQKPFRRSLMKIWGAEVFASPSTHTQSGRSILKKDPACRGSLGIAISEAVEEAAGDNKTNYALGSVLNHVMLHQTVIGIEAKEQLSKIGETADIVIGCVGGGSNFGGLAFPFVPEKLKRPRMRIIAVEPAACPTLTKGVYRYDFGDTAGLTPLVKMYTLGHEFLPPGIHAGGLRYHGASPIVSAMKAHGLIEACAYHQTEVFKAAQLFARAEGLIPAPETSHAIRAAIDVAKTEKNRAIIFNLSGHGFLDLGSYDRFLDGHLRDFALPKREIVRSLKHLPEMA